MKFRNVIRVFVIFIMSIMITVSIVPIQMTSAKDSENYLVIVEQKDGTFKSYDNLVYETADSHLLVKASRTATALGMTFKNSNGTKKGCTLTLGNKELTFTRNSTTYYYNSGGTKKKMTAEFKQSYISSTNMIDYKTLSSIYGCSYYNTEKVLGYYYQGYSGVIVYSIKQPKPALPSYKWFFGGNVDVMVYNSYSTDGSRQVVANYSIADGPNKLLLDLNLLQSEYKQSGLPSDGVYGYGNCDGVITIQGIDKNGSVVDEVTTTGKGFFVDFPDAIALYITGEIKNLIINFTPVKPILITETVTLSPEDIDWLSPDGFSGQYFVIPPHTNFTFYHWTIQPPYHSVYGVFEVGNQEPYDFNDAYQLLSLNFALSPKQFIEGDGYELQFKIMKDVINNSSVAVYDNEENSQAVNYESELIRMIDALKTVGLNTYFPSKNWESQLKINVKNGTENGSGFKINITPEDTNLNEPADYYVHLHEMTHFYEMQQNNYVIRAWVEGNAVALAEQALAYMNISYYNYYFNADLSFLTEDNKKNFEDYYLNVHGGDEYIVGYHFNKFLRDTYGEDVICRITDKVIEKKFTSNNKRTNESDKLFADCIKAVTSKDVFQRFIDEYVNK